MALNGSNSDDPIAVVRDINKDYIKGKIRVPVLQQLDLDIQRGDFIGLMGPSGSGKTTLLNLLGGLDRPDTGSVRVDGEPIDRMSRSGLTDWRARNIGFIFQFYQLLPVLSAASNVELPLLLTGLSRQQRRKRVDAALQVVGLDRRSKHFPGELSGGQQQRVAIARAIVADPALLLCDEPTGDLDRASGTEILELLRVLNREHGKTVILVTHDPKAATYANQVHHLDKGGLSRSTAPHVEPATHTG